MKTIATYGDKADSINILTSLNDKNFLDELGVYYNSAGIPILNTVFDSDAGAKKTDVFCLSLAKTKNLL